MTAPRRMRTARLPPIAAAITVAAGIEFVEDPVDSFVATGRACALLVVLIGVRLEVDAGLLEGRPLCAFDAEWTSEDPAPEDCAEDPAALILLENVLWDEKVDVD